MTFGKTHCIILFVKRISPSGVLFIKLYPLLIIYTPLIEKTSGSPAGLFSCAKTGPVFLNRTLTFPGTIAKQYFTNSFVQCLAFVSVSFCHAVSLFFFCIQYMIILRPFQGATPLLLISVCFSGRSVRPSAKSHS